MNTVEMFETIERHLLQQMKRSVTTFPGDDEAMCLYRGPEGLKCAVGVLISEAEYSPDLERLGIDDHEVQVAVENSIGRDLTRFEMNMLNDLQNLHDKEDPQLWAISLTNLKKQYSHDDTND